ncbi:MAG: response regulator [Pseudomonadales bacterium]|nr:response regulator [Pseudomonadales bacterium]
MYAKFNPKVIQPLLFHLLRCKPFSYPGILLLFIIVTSGAFANENFHQNSSLSHRPLKLAEEEKVFLSGCLEYAVASHQELSIEKLLLGNGISYKPYNGGALVKQAEDVYFRCTIENTLAVDRELLLRLDVVHYNEITFFYQQGDKVVQQQAGLDYPYAQRPLDYRLYAFPFSLPANSSLTVYLKINSSHYPLFFPYIIDRFSAKSLSDMSSNYNLLIIGGMAGVFLYVLFIMFYTREFENLIPYTLYVLSSLLMVLYLKGFIYTWMPQSPVLHQYIYILLSAALCFAFPVFTRNYFQLKYAHKKLDWLMKISALLALIVMLLPAVLSKTDAINATLIAANFVILATLGTSLYMWWLKRGSYGFHALGMVLFTGMTYLPLLGGQGVLNSYMLSQHGYETASLLLALLFAFAITDKTNRYREEKRALEVSEAMARAESQEKSEFLAKMSHEIRTPMNGVLGMLQLLGSTKLDAEQRHYLDVVNSSGQSLLSIINNVLDYSKVTQGHLELEMINFELPALVETVCDTFRLSSEKNHQLELQLAENLPARVIGDPTRIRQVLVNLISNAYKFTEQGQIRVECEWRPISSERGHVYFSVVDNGVGISEQQQDGLFESFSQADVSTTRKYGGTGLGLSICKELVELMNGDIGFQSVEHEGSTFWFNLAMDIVSESNKNTVIYFTQELDWPGFETAPRILLAEDNMTNQLVMKGYLAKLGLQADIVVSGSDAVDRVSSAERPYDIIFMDCEMPEMDGYTATRQIRAYEANNHQTAVPIIAVTAHAIKELRQKCLDAGMNAHLSKPFTLKELKAVIEQYLAEKYWQRNEVVETECID